MVLGIDVKGGFSKPQRMFGMFNGGILHGKSKYQIPSTERSHIQPGEKENHRLKSELVHVGDMLVAQRML